MKILIMDDAPIRHSLFDKWNVAKHEIVHTFDKDSALEAVKTTKFDLAFLDHDLGDTSESGYAFIDAMMTLESDQWPKNIIVISHNPSGASNMIAKVNQQIPIRHVPFGSELNKFL